jgi:hypothetical protein
MTHYVNALHRIALQATLDKFKQAEPQCKDFEERLSKYTKVHRSSGRVQVHRCVGQI